MATRKSTRKSTRQTTGKAEGSQNGKTSTEKDVSSQDLVPINEKTNGKTRDWFTFIPLDVCLEVFKLLEPVDLLHLSRVSKRLQEFLTSNNMVSLWKSAYTNIAPDPRRLPCPDHINVVFYTNYLYSKCCQFCSCKNAQLFLESAFIRVCMKCMKKKEYNLPSSDNFGIIIYKQ